MSSRVKFIMTVQKNAINVYEKMPPNADNCQVNVVFLDLLCTESNVLECSE